MLQTLALTLNEPNLLSKNNVKEQKWTHDDSIFIVGAKEPSYLMRKEETFSILKEWYIIDYLLNVPTQVSMQGQVAFSIQGMFEKEQIERCVEAILYAPTALAHQNFILPDIFAFKV